MERGRERPALIRFLQLRFHLLPPALPSSLIASLRHFNAVGKGPTREEIALSTVGTVEEFHRTRPDRQPPAVAAEGEGVDRGAGSRIAGGVTLPPVSVGKVEGTSTALRGSRVEGAIAAESSAGRAAGGPVADA